MAISTASNEAVIASTLWNQLAGMVNGTSGYGQPVALTDLGSATWVTNNAGSDASSLWALTVRNQGSGGQGLRVQNAAGSTIFSVADAGITMPSADLSVDTLTLGNTGKALTALPTALIDVGIGLNNITDYTRVGISEIKGGGALTAASGRHANSYGTYAPVVASNPQVAYLSYVTPDIADTSTSGGETTGNHSFALVRTGSGLLPGMASGSTGAQAAVALTITAVSADSVTVSGLTTANTTDYVGWRFLVTTGSAAGIARKITAHTASATPVFTLDSATSWGTTPSTNDKATLNYGQTVDFANVLSTFRDDSSIVSSGGAHTTKGFGAYGRNTATSTGYVQGFFGLLTNYSPNGASIGSELDVGNASNYAHRYWNGGAVRSSAGLIVAGTRGTYETFTAGTVSTTTIQKSGASWTVNEHTGKGVYVQTGSQAGAQRIVTSNTADTLTFTPTISTSGLTGSTIHLGSLWNGAALVIGTTGAAADSRGAGWLHGIQFDDYAFAEEGAFGLDFKPSSGVDFPIRIPNGTALYAWKTGETWAGTYPAGTAYTATHGHVPLIGTAAGGNITYIGTDTQLVLVSNTTGAFGTEILRLGTAGLTFAAAAAVQTTTAAGITIKTNSTTRMEFGSGATIGVFGVTPASRASAYTQTYATATRTHANLTSSDLSGITSSTTGSALTEPDAAYVQATWQTNMRRIQDQVNALRADLANVKQVLNSVITDHKAYGWFQ